MMPRKYEEEEDWDMEERQIRQITKKASTIIATFQLGFVTSTGNPTICLLLIYLFVFTLLGFIS